MNEPGQLYVVSTPIGNLSDFSARGAQILASVDLIAAEDTRHSLVLLNSLGIKNKLASNHKYNEHGKAQYFIRLLLEGKSIALISDAGTPCISDPGNELIRAAVENGVTVMGIPGCCAITTAVSVSGFDLRSFEFLGFFPKSAGERKTLLEKMRQNRTTRTFVVYESPKRLESFLSFLIENAVSCSLCVCNDISKYNELIFRGSPETVLSAVEAKFGNDPKGEYCIVMELAEEYMLTGADPVFSAEGCLVDAMTKHRCSLKDAIELLKDDSACAYSKKELYNAGLRLKELFHTL